MNLIDKLNSVSKTSNDLPLFLAENITTVYDFFLSSKYSELQIYQTNIEEYLYSNIRIIHELDLSVKNNYTFVTILLDVCEQFGFLFHFQQLYVFLISSNSEISKRLEAASLFLMGIRRSSDYENICPLLLNTLHKSIEFEEDNSSKAIATLTHFYSEVVNNFGQFNKEGVKRISEIILNSLAEFPFFNNDFIIDIFSKDISDFSKTVSEINIDLENFLKSKSFELTVLDEYDLIEKNTSYSRILESTSPKFSEIRKISTNLRDDELNKSFYSLCHGTAILTEEDQLFSYMYSYGKMHYAKLINAFEYLPLQLFEQKIEIIDWACGQALGSMVYLEFLLLNKYTQVVKSITLNEPSGIAIKRGALHISKYNNMINPMCQLSCPPKM